MYRSVLGTALLILFLFVAVAPRGAHGEDFRVETKVFNGKDAKPASENLTLFCAGKVYDFLSEPAGDEKGAVEHKQISILDAHANRMVLLDPDRHVRTELKCDRLIEITGSLKAVAVQSNNAFLRFAAEPKFSETVGSTGDELTFSSPVMTYRVRTKKANSSEAVRQYCEFCDVYARLNVATSPGAPPPFPRLALDEALGKRELVPSEVELTINEGRLGSKPIVRRSEHLFHWRLLESDQRRIEDAADALAKFDLVDLDDYLHPAPETPKLSAK